MNLEDLPQLVMEKITAVLNHKQLLTLEQVSKALKCAVDAHFSTTNHLIIGSLPRLDTDYPYDQTTAKNKKCIDGLRKIIKRCGIRLRTIQETLTYDFGISNYDVYFSHVFASAEVSNKCPNIENIIASPNMDIITVFDPNVFFQQNVLLDTVDVEGYANNIKLSTGEACKLRTIRLPERMGTEGLDHAYQRILNLYSNIEQLSVYNPGENFFKFLHRFMENGLKDLDVSGIGGTNIRIATKYYNIWKDLRALRLVVTVQNDDDIAALNKLQLPKIAKLKINLTYDCSAHLNENICNSVIDCNVFRLKDTGSYSLLSKFKSLQKCDITNLGNFRVIAKGSFPKLRKIKISCTLCWRCNPMDGVKGSCDLQTLLPQLLINSNQLTYIDIKFICNKSILVIWKALRHCQAAKMVRFERIVLLPLTITYDDVEAICHLPNLQRFMFWIPQIIGEEDTGGLIRQLMKRAVKEHTDFKFEYTLRRYDPCEDEHEYLLYRTNF